MKNVTRRDFLRFGATGMAGAAAAVNFPMGSRLALAGLDSDFFTIAVISDTQNYNDGTQPQPFNKNFFQDQARYLAKNMYDLKLSFVTHVGDMVEHSDGSGVAFPAGSPQNLEWLNAMKAMDILDATGVPFGTCAGNHDYDNIYSATPPTIFLLGEHGPLVEKLFRLRLEIFSGQALVWRRLRSVGYISTGTWHRG